MVSRGLIRYMDDLRLLPPNRSFVLSDYLTGWTGGRANYWKQRNLIRQVGIVFKNGSKRRAVWELTERARRILG